MSSIMPMPDGTLTAVATRVLVTGSAGHLGEALVRVLRDGGYEVTVGFGNASASGGLIVAGELSFFHAGHADEADDALRVLKNEASSDLIGDGRYQAAVGFWHGALRRGALGWSGVGYWRVSNGGEISGAEQKHAGYDKENSLTHLPRTSYVRSN